MIDLKKKLHSVSTELSQRLDWGMPEKRFEKLD